MVAANWMPDLVLMAGGEPGLTQRGAHSGYADWCKIVEYDPQAILIMPCGFDLPRAIQEAQTLPALPGWNQLSAVRENRVFAADGNAYFNRSGPRLIDSAEILAHVLHPNMFPPPRDDQAATAWRRMETRDRSLVAV
jgi:iron complex transport system substrate-binding protein